MTYVVGENCIRCKYMDCVEVCPVDCFYAGENMLVINPSECIDCGVCEPECPAKAIVPHSDDRASAFADATRISYPFPCWENGLVDYWGDEAAAHRAAVLRQGYLDRIRHRRWVARAWIRRAF